VALGRKLSDLSFTTVEWIPSDSNGNFAAVIGTSNGKLALFDATTQKLREVGAL
jgi:hypothetical protein